MKEFEIAKKAITEAGEEILKIYKKDYSINYKEKNNPVTSADLISQEILTKHLKFFNYPILSEEKKDSRERLKAKKVWIIDPLDGTKDFIQKTDEFTIMLGLVEKGEVKMGLVFQPTKDNLYFGLKNEGSYLLNNQKTVKLKTSSIESFKKSTLLVSRNHLLEFEKKLIENLEIAKSTPCGSAGLKICKIAEGSADLYINSSNKTYEWDICAADVILSEAQGKLVDLKDGEKFFYNKENVCNLNGFIASNKSLNLNKIIKDKI